ncbi:uncharacterized protein LOC141733659 isoform X2 [Larus michahellis]|uniref:uncharacterized protein LOC141733659 isoform X2 n=1 Tax=Larus michahellis TaxID=119627 RepID=UPI003D9B7E89
MSAPSSPATTTTTTTAAASSAPPPHAAAPAAAPAAAAAPAPFDASGPDGLPRCGGVARWKDSERGTERNEQGRSYVCSRDKCWEKRKSRNRVTSQHPADPQYGKLQRIRNVSPGCLSKSDMEIQKDAVRTRGRLISTNRCRLSTTNLLRFLLSVLSHWLVCTTKKPNTCTPPRFLGLQSTSSLCSSGYWELQKK